MEILVSHANHNALYALEIQQINAILVQQLTELLIIFNFQPLIAFQFVLMVNTKYYQIIHANYVILIVQLVMVKALFAFHALMLILLILFTFTIMNVLLSVQLVIGRIQQLKLIINVVLATIIVILVMGLIMMNAIFVEIKQMLKIIH